MSYIRVLLSTLTMTFLLGCPSERPPVRRDMEAPARDAAFCEAITTQKACFEGGCSFFTNTTALEFTPDGTCTTAETKGVCLWSEDPEGDPLLTSYQRMLEDGRVEALRLNFDVELDGWRRCGGLDITRDCDCDGAADF